MKARNAPALVVPQFEIGRPSRSVGCSVPICYWKARHGTSMTVIQREFYRSARGPSPRDEDWWTLIFDRANGRLFVRHEWQAAGHSGVDEFEIPEFLNQEGAAQTALIEACSGFALMPRGPKAPRYLQKASRRDFKLRH
jgi:hypothetical protein